MLINTSLNCGDKAWTFEGDFVRQRTVGQIQITYTESPGVGDGFMEGGIIVNGGENYAPMRPTLVEKYMCVETGIGSGSVFTLGESLFLTREECETANAKRIEERQRQLRERKDYERKQLLSEESYLRSKLAKIDALKAEESKQ